MRRLPILDRQQSGQSLARMRFSKNEVSESVCCPVSAKVGLRLRHLNPEKQTMSIATARDDQTPYQPLGVLPFTLRVLESFEEFVRLNPDLVVEQNSNGEI